MNISAWIIVPTRINHWLKRFSKKFDGYVIFIVTRLNPRYQSTYIVSAQKNALSWHHPKLNLINSEHWYVEIVYASIIKWGLSFCATRKNMQLSPIHLSKAINSSTLTGHHIPLASSSLWFYRSPTPHLISLVSNLSIYFFNLLVILLEISGK